MNDGKILEIEKVIGKRRILGEMLPLRAPLALNVTVSNVCNLKCEFCANAVSGHKRNKSFMDLNIAKKLADTCLDSFGRGGVKQAVLAGVGEPLLNPEICEIVSCMADSGAFAEIHIVTNGTKLTEELSLKLIESGLTTLRVSVNGLSNEDYEKYTGTKVEYTNLLNQLKFFYKNKKGALLYVKTMDYMVDSVEKLESFQQDFGKISDVQNVEHILNISDELDNSRLMDKSRKLNMKGGEMVCTEICSLPFYSLNVNEGGTVSACCRGGAWFAPSRLIVGDIKKESMKEIWNGRSLIDLYVHFLEKKKGIYDKVCANCEFYMPNTYKEDILEPYADKLIEIFKER